jgi:hypothetical protein
MSFDFSRSRSLHPPCPETEVASYPTKDALLEGQLCTRGCPLDLLDHAVLTPGGHFARVPRLMHKRWVTIEVLTY